MPISRGNFSCLSSRDDQPLRPDLPRVLRQLAQGILNRAANTRDNDYQYNDSQRPNERPA